MSASPEYPIALLTDFLAVPRERLGECLTDFAAWLAVRRESVKFDAELSEIFGAAPGGIQSLDSFTWIDDGERGIRQLHFVTASGEELGRLDLREPSAETSAAGASAGDTAQSPTVEQRDGEVNGGKP